MAQIIKSITGCFLASENGKIITVKALGKHKQNGIIVGDNVELEKINLDYVISRVLPRRNELIRPYVANIDQLLIVIASVPQVDYSLVDKMLLKCEMLGIVPVIVINKIDLDCSGFINEIKKVYSFVKIIEISVKNSVGLEDLKRVLEGKLSALCGQSAVGKSSILNVLCPEACAETNGLSLKTERGKHTTRHSEIFIVNSETKIIDTPGFSMFNIADVEPNQIAYLMQDFLEFSAECKYQPCEHISQRDCDCAVKRALKNGKISQTRYDNYVKIYNAQKPLWKRRNSYE